MSVHDPVLRARVRAELVTVKEDAAPVFDVAAAIRAMWDRGASVGDICVVQGVTMAQVYDAISEDEPV